jgi:hypothetical protein
LPFVELGYEKALPEGVFPVVNIHEVWQKEKSPGEIRNSLCGKELRRQQGIFPMTIKI